MLHNVNKHKSTVIAILIWLGAVLVFFAPCTLGGKVIAPIDCMECIFRPFADRPIEEVHNQYLVDAVSQYIPYKWAIKESFEQDGYMGWNPMLFSGTTIPANTMLSPGDWHNWLFAVLPYWDAWNLAIILHFFIAGCGVIVLLRHYKIHIVAVLLAAVSYAFYSQFVMWLYDKWLGTMIWAPFLVWALFRFKHYMINVPAIVFLSLAWRGGHMQSCVFIFLLVALVWVAEVWKEDGQWPTLKNFSRITLSYLLTGILSVVLTLDVFVDTLPVMDGCRELGFQWGWSNILSIITCIFPTLYGVPQSMDVGKMFDSSLFDVKFGGGIVFIISLIACFNHRAPRVAKVIFMGSFLLTCTPLYTYIYSRSTVVMALGMAWLAAWQIDDFTKNSISSICWKRILYGLLIVVGGWLICSVFVVCFRESLLEILNRAVAAQSSTAQNMGRQAWYELRCERFLSQILIFDWKNIALCVCVIFGVYCAFRIRPGNKRNALWMSGLLIITYADVVTYSSVWLSYSPHPSGSYLYKTPSWMPELKQQVKDGSVAICNPVHDLDFLCTNHLSTYGIRLADGYETVRQQSIRPLQPREYDAEDYALAGVSHILCDKKWSQPSFPGWRLVMVEKKFNLYENPLYSGRYLSDSNVPVKENWRTYNRISLNVPASVKELTILESYHKGWKACVGEQEIAITPTERGGMYLQLPPSDKDYELRLQFRMPYRMLYYPIMGLCALSLLVAAYVQCRTGIKYKRVLS